MNVAGRGAVVVGGGFIGSAAARALSADGWAVTQITRAGSAPALPNVDRVLIDHRSRAVLNHLAGAKVVVHATGEMLPAYVPDDFAAAYVEQVAPIITLAERAHQVGVGKMLFISSGGTVYGPKAAVPAHEESPTEPNNAYGFLKLQTEHALRFVTACTGMPTLSLRVANPYGPGQRTDRAFGFVSTVFERALRDEEVVIWGDGETTRDFLFIEDLGRAIAAAAAAAPASPVVNIGSGNEVSLNHICSLVEQVTGRRVRRIYQPPRSVDVPRSALAIERARAELSWKPQVTLEDGLRRMLEAR
ncbi:NAD-dependent epimerase/dehydratase family protein [Sphingomonas sp. IC-11]|uniref:NAD-dependent epimerase/dehydratase family protein n=1 Tax=Sphingomonas sp. IC-11 TaxID=2898528 RepID=UPI001E54CD24|nr:NAD-dependent epimerase/dehydratase family protein [Sphingomonas sp. IC-11]MCD2316598.1 NAD-dependent epimerase/dehydratase family protein [Sphingomonas sp. IC-11]